MYQSAQKTTRCQRSSQRLRHAKYIKCHRFLQQPFSNVVPESESSAVKRMRTPPASRREGTQLSRKVNEMPPSFLKLNSPFRTPFRTFFSLPHMMLVLCFWSFLRFWAQNTPNPTRFCTFAPFSWLERWHRAENSPFSTRKEKYISRPNLNIFCLFSPPHRNPLHLLEHVPEKVLGRGEILKAGLIVLDKSKLYTL